jgi:transcriptional regulator with XRE-family HTH domain
MRRALMVRVVGPNAALEPFETSDLRKSNKKRIGGQYQIKRSSGSARADGTINPRDVLLALKRCISESEDNERRTAAELGVSRVTLYRWLADKAEPHKRALLRVAGFLKRAGYL